MDARLGRYGRTSKEFRRWLKANPNANLNRRVEAFNAIADSEFAIESRADKRTLKKAKAKI